MSLDEQLARLLRDETALSTVRFFIRGDRKACYGENARLVAREVLRSSTSLRTFKLNGSDTAWLSLPDTMFAKAARYVLKEKRMAVELYEACQGKWALLATGTFGNLGDYLEDAINLGSHGAEDDEAFDCSSYMALFVDQTRDKSRSSVGDHISAVFLADQQSRIWCLDVDDSESLDLLQQSLVSLHPVECVCVGPGAETLFAMSASGKGKKSLSSSASTLNHRLLALFEECSVTLALEREDALKSVDWNMVASRLLQEVSDPIQLCIRALVSRFSLIDDDDGGGGDSTTAVSRGASIEMSALTLDSFVRLQPAALTALEVFSQSYGLFGGAGSKATLYDTINRCQSPAGRRLLKHWLRNPLGSLKAIERRADVVSLLLGAHTHRARLGNLVKRAPDFASIAKKARRRRATLLHCYSLYQALQHMDQLRELLETIADEADVSREAEALRELVLDELTASTEACGRFRAMLDEQIDHAYFAESGLLRLRPDINAELSAACERVTRLEEEALAEIRTSVKAMQLSADDVKIERYGKEARFVGRLSSKHEPRLRQVPGLSLVAAKAAGRILFTSRELERLNEALRDARQVYDEAQRELVQLVLHATVDYCSVFCELGQRLAQLDVLLSFATLATTSASRWTRPVLTDGGGGDDGQRNEWTVKALRHPVVEALSRDAFQPHSFSLSSSSGSFMLLTGANMGGKSTLLRAAAIAQILAQCGCLVPAEEAHFSLVDAIFTRVGANDSVSAGQSTFFVEMLDSAHILAGATSRSLVVIDELGRGTSTFDGFGLARAIADSLVARGCRTIFATHLHELAKLETDHPQRVQCVYLKSSTDDGERVRMLYELETGCAPSSFGLDVAKLLNYPDQLLREAERLRDVLRDEGKSQKTSGKENLVRQLKLLATEENDDEVLMKRARLLLGAAQK